MRCPKCQYISYDSHDRCRNCGYEFSLALDVEPMDLPIQTGKEAVGPLGDFSLSLEDRKTADQAQTARPAGEFGFDDLELSRRDGSGPAIDRVGADPPLARAAQLTPSALDVSGLDLGGDMESRTLRPAVLSHDRGGPAPGGGEAAAPARRASDLPLFNEKAGSETAPLVRPAAPRPPLGVRRPTPAAAPKRHAAPPAPEPVLDLDLPLPAAASPASRIRAGVPRDATGEVGRVAAPAGARLVAAAIDAAILGSIGAGVVYLTLRLCGMTVAQVTLIPIAPMTAFLLWLAVSYLAGFTAAAGQTIGKMALGLKVVPVTSYPPGRDRVSLGVAALRSSVCLLSLLPAGLGLVPALFGPDHRALHDRLADTRVIRA